MVPRGGVGAAGRVGIKRLVPRRGVVVAGSVGGERERPRGGVDGADGVVIERAIPGSSVKTTDWGGRPLATAAGKRSEREAPHSRVVVGVARVVRGWHLSERRSWKRERADQS